MKFQTTIKQNGKTATGIQIPDEVIAAQGAGKKPPVKLTVNGYTYRSTVATVDGNFMVGFNADHRAASGLQDTEPRTVELPSDFAAALTADADARQTFDKLSNSMKGYHVAQVTAPRPTRHERPR